MRCVLWWTYDYITDSQKEVNNSPSLTDASEYEPLESILKRCLVGDFSKGSIAANYDGFDEKATDEEMLADLSPQDTTDFDLADKAEIEANANVALKSLQKKGAKAPESSEPEKSKTSDVSETESSEQKKS